MVVEAPNSATLNDRPDAEYHADFGRLSASMLKTFKKSRRDYHERYIERSKEHPPTKPQMDIGSAIHPLFMKLPVKILQFPRECFTEGGKFKKNAREDYKAEHHDAICLTEQEYEWVEGAIASLRKHEGAMRVLEYAQDSGYVEQEVNWLNAHGQYCRCKLDLAIEGETKGYIYDLKCTKLVAPDDFYRHLKLMKAWIQQAHYSTGFGLLLGKPIEFNFIVVNPEPPHQVQITRIDSDSANVAKNCYDVLLYELQRCKKEDDWREPWEKESNEITLKDWDYE